MQIVGGKLEYRAEWCNVVFCILMTYSSNIFLLLNGIYILWINSRLETHHRPDKPIESMQNAMPWFINYDPLQSKCKVTIRVFVVLLCPYFTTIWFNCVIADIQSQTRSPKGFCCKFPEMALEAFSIGWMAYRNQRVCYTTQPSWGEVDVLALGRCQGTIGADRHFGLE